MRKVPSRLLCLRGWMHERVIQSLSVLKIWADILQRPAQISQRWARRLAYNVCSAPNFPSDDSWRRKRSLFYDVCITWTRTDAVNSACTTESCSWDLGFQIPDTCAAAILTPNVIRAGRMGKWTNSSHVVTAIGGYTGISSSSIAEKYDSSFHDERLQHSMYHSYETLSRYIWGMPEPICWHAWRWWRIEACLVALRCAWQAICWESEIVAFRCQLCRHSSQFSYEWTHVPSRYKRLWEWQQRATAWILATGTHIRPSTNCKRLCASHPTQFLQCWETCYHRSIVAFAGSLPGLSRSSVTFFRQWKTGLCNQIAEVCAVRQRTVKAFAM